MIAPVSRPEEQDTGAVTMSKTEPILGQSPTVLRLRALGKSGPQVVVPNVNLGHLHEMLDSGARLVTPPRGPVLLT